MNLITQYGLLVLGLGLILYILDGLYSNVHILPHYTIAYTIPYTYACVTRLLAINMRDFCIANFATSHSVSTLLHAGHAQTKCA